MHAHASMLHAHKGSRCCYGKLPTDDFRMNGMNAGTMVTSMQAADGSSDRSIATIPGAKWDEGGLFGCCANGRGCAGCTRLCYVSVCTPCAQSELSMNINGLRGTAPMSDITSVLLAVAPAIAASTKNSMDDVALTGSYAAQMEALMPDDPASGKMGGCTRYTYSCCFPTCMITWELHTVDNMIELKKKKSTGRIV